MSKIFAFHGSHNDLTASVPSSSSCPEGPLPPGGGTPDIPVQKFGETVVRREKMLL